MVDNKKSPKQEFLDSMTEEKARVMGYPSLEIFMLQEKLITLGYKIHHGDERFRDEYYSLLDEALAKGWTPSMLDGQQEMWLGTELYAGMFEKYEAYQVKVLK
jgi:hypothetical protein